MLRCVQFVMAALLAGAMAAPELNSLKVKFPSYFDIALTVPNLLASSSNYTFMTKDTELNVDFYSYNRDPRLLIGYDTFGNIAGLRLAYVKGDLSKHAEQKNEVFPIEFYNKPMYKSGRFCGCTPEVFYTDVLFAHPDKIKAGGRSDTGGVSVEDLYIRLKGQWTLISKDEKIQNPGFTKQACFPGMGMHYWYFPSRDMNCVDLEGFFGLYDQGHLVGLGVAAFGSQGSTSERVWYENPTFAIFQAIAPLQPYCLKDYMDRYAAISFHMFFISDPKSLTCPKN